MGICLPCLNGSSEDYGDLQPDPETRRAQQAAAAEQRIKAQESRGVKDPEALKRKQQRQDELEKKAAQSPDDGSGLQWQVG
ncbi:hypothetical protein LSAT2_008765 [Lamellibrachia satsuma]|nr:hypothetical protein LSAT2_008765 [Lamellibrachia satsuma]